MRVLLFLAVIGFASTVSAQTRIKFTLDWRFEGQTSFMWLGLQRGYFQREGLEVQVDMPTLATQIDYIAASVKLKDKPAAGQLFNPSFLPPLAERLPLK